MIREVFMGLIRKLLSGAALLASIAIFVAVIAVNKDTFASAFDGNIWKGIQTVGDLIAAPLTLFIVSLVGLTVPSRS
jgi:hypothetical protein